MRLRVAVAIGLLVTLASCSADSPMTSTPPPAPARTDPTATPRDRLTPREIVDDPRSVLRDARVREVPGGLEITAWWQLTVHGRSRSALAISRDGFETATYERWTRAWYQRLGNLPEPPQSGRLLPWPLPTLAGDTDDLAYALGSDGATLFPFEQTARSRDGGTTWESFTVDLGVKPRGYLSGGVVRADGRLLALIGYFSDDRPLQASDQHHGLWVSRDVDWDAFVPYESSYEPPLAQSPRGYPMVVSLQADPELAPGVVWSTTTDDLLYLSADDGATFTQVPVR